MRRHEALTDDQLTSKIHLVMDSMEKNDSIWNAALLQELLLERRVRVETAKQ